MKKILTFILLLLPISAVNAFAQDIIIPEGYEVVDSVIYFPAAAMDSSLVGKNIFYELPSMAKGDRASVNVHQSQAIVSAMSSHISRNSTRQIQGYRVRIFFDNKQNSRTASETTLSRFTSTYRNIAAYRSYANPYFKVTVGDFRTKSEAMQLLQAIRYEFPTAFVVKESINYPAIDKENSYIADTIKVLRPIQTSL